jgi:uncharacterized spore protein YtfJ
MLERMLERIGEIQEHASVKTAFGEPYQVNGRTLIPVAKVAYGFGFGGGPSKVKEAAAEESRGGAGGGGGGRLVVRPVAVLDVTGGETAVKPIVDVTRLAIAGMALAAWNVFWITYTVRRVRGRRSLD